MGFKFGGTSFVIGIVEVSLDHIDTEKMTATIRLTVPALGGKFQLKLYSGITWENTRAMNIELDFHQASPPAEDTSEEDIDWEGLEDKDDDA